MYFVPSFLLAQSTNWIAVLVDSNRIIVTINIFKNFSLWMEIWEEETGLKFYGWYLHRITFSKASMMCVSLF